MSPLEPVFARMAGRYGGLMIAAVAVLLWAFRVEAAGDLAKGKGYYAQWCSPCHGMTGKGDGPVAATLNPKPRNHTDDKLMSTLTDEAIFQTIKGGGASVKKSSFMPSFGTVGNPFGIALNDQQIWDLVGYIRTLHRSNSSQAQPK